MNLTPLQLYCLKEMQIPIWQGPTYGFLVYLEKELQQYNEAERTLLAKILQALKWPESAVAYKKISAEEFHLLDKIHQDQPMLIFSDILLNHAYQHSKMVVVSSLTSMLAQPALKKQAWHNMQVLLG